MPDAGAPLPSDLPPIDPASTRPPDAPPALAVPLPLDGVGSLAYWRDEIERAQKRRKKELPLWKANLSRYRGELPKLPGVSPTDVILVNTDFANTEQKKAQLFFQNPEVIVAPKDQVVGGQASAALQAQASLRAKVLNYYLGPHEMNCAEMVDQVLIDHLCPAGFGGSVLGYESQSVQVAVPIDPTTPTAGTQPVPKRIWCRFFWEHLSVEKVLRPAGWLSTDSERSPWLGYELEIDKDTVAQSQPNPSDTPAIRPKRRDAFDKSNSLAGPNDREFLDTPEAVGYVIWYRAADYDKSVQDPTRYRRLVLVAANGAPEASIHEDSPFQTLGPAGNVIGGMRGSPIHLLFLRPLTASAYPPSDCSIGRASADELSQGRTQMMLQKRRSLPQRGVDKTRVGKEVTDKMEQGEIQSIILTDGDPAEAIKVLGMASFPRENFTFNDYIQVDNDKAWALGSNAQGVQNPKAITATQSSLIQQATDTRMTKERNRVLHWYATGAGKIMALLEKFMTLDDLMPLVGQDGTQLWQQSVQTAPGRFLFSIRPDSSIRTDNAEDRQQLLNAYNMLARDPHIDRVALISQIVEKFGFDPSKLVIPQLPPQPPDAPKIAVSLTAADLQTPSVIELLKDYGVTITPDTVTQTIATATGHPLPPPPPGPPQTPPGPSPSEAQHPPPSHRAPSPNRAHPGAALRSQPINQHQLDQTGDRSGPKGL